MNNTQKLPFQISLGMTARKGAESAIGLLARSLPASVVEANGSIVKVKFEVLSEYNLPEIEVPVAGSEYVRIPLKKGDKGILVPCEADISGVCGTSTNTADLETPPNLSSLWFVPIGNKEWGSVDAEMLTLTGRSDVMLRDDANQVQLEDVNTSWQSLISQLNAWVPILAGVGAAVPQITANTNPVKPRA